MCVPKDKARILMEGEEHKYTAFQLIYEIFNDDMCLFFYLLLLNQKHLKICIYQIPLFGNKMI